MEQSQHKPPRGLSSVGDLLSQSPHCNTEIWLVIRIVVVFCNVGGDCVDAKRSVAEDEKEGYFGSSQITMPFKEQVAKCDWREQCIVVSVEDVDDILRDTEEIWDVRRDVRSNN